MTESAVLEAEAPAEAGEADPTETGEAEAPAATGEETAEADPDGQDADGV